MKIAKEFNWEMGHRLPFHKGKCINLHGHSYRLILEVEGELDANGMLIDFYDMKTIINPLVEELDHAVIVYKEDLDLIAALEKLSSKKVVVDFHSTCENICNYFLSEIKKIGFPSNINSVSVRVFETLDSYAEERIELQ